MSSSRFDVFVLFVFSAGALGAALVAQYGFDLAPCHLCTLQRMPYGFVLLLTLLVGPDPRQRALRLSLAALTFSVGAGLGFFHIGVEHHWWESACSGAEALSNNAGGLLAKLAKGGAEPACDSVPFELFGVSLAGMNLILSTLLALYAAVAARRAWRSA